MSYATPIVFLEKAGPRWWAYSLRLNEGDSFKFGDSFTIRYSVAPIYAAAPSQYAWKAQIIGASVRWTTSGYNIKGPLIRRGFAVESPFPSGRATWSTPYCHGDTEGPVPVSEPSTLFMFCFGIIFMIGNNIERRF
jgi:hypothetical protein